MNFGGCGPFLHKRSHRPPGKIFLCGQTSCNSEKYRQPYLLLPVIPQNSAQAELVGFLAWALMSVQNQGKRAQLKSGYWYNRLVGFFHASCVGFFKRVNALRKTK